MRLPTLVFLSLALCGPAWGQGKIDGNPLWQFCGPEIGLTCASFMTGALSGLNTNAAFRERVCFPEDITLEKAIAVAVEYEAAHDLDELPAIMVLMLAYSEAYPCD